MYIIVQNQSLNQERIGHFNSTESPLDFGNFNEIV